MRRCRVLGVALVAVMVLYGYALAQSRPSVPRPAAEPPADVGLTPPATPSAPPAQPTGLVITRATTKGEVKEKLAFLSMTIEAESRGKGEQRALLFSGDAAVADWAIREPFFGPEGRVVRTEKGVELVVDGAGDYTVTLKLVVGVSKEKLGQKVVIPVVPALVAKAELKVPGKDLEFKAEPEVSLETEARADYTVVTLYGGIGRVSLSWAPKAPEKVVKPILFADQTLHVRIGQGVMRLETTLDYAIVQGSVNEFAIRLPAGLSLLNIEGKYIRTWDIEGAKDDEPRILKLSLLTDVEKEYSLKLSLEKVLPDIRMDIEVPLVEPLNIVREKGQVAVAAAKGISVESVTTENISPVDVREMMALPPILGEDVRLAFRYLKRPFTLKLRTGEVVAKTSVEANTLVRAGADSLRLTSDLNYTIRDTGVFRFRVRLDEGLKLIDINGRDINNWELDEKARVLTVALRSKAEGAYRLSIETEIAKGPAEKAPVPGVHALDVDRESGYLAIVPAPGMKVETASLVGISQMDVKELPQELLKHSPALAYRYIRPEYQVAINVSEIQPEVEAEVRTLASLDEHELSLDTEIHYSIRRAGIFQLRVAIPKELRRTRIEGKEIDDTSWDDQEGVLTVNLRTKVTGSYVLKLGTEQALEEIEKGVELPVMKTVGLKKEQGFLALVTKASVRIKPAEGKIAGLVAVSVSDLPPEMIQGAKEIALAFKYYSQPWSLALAVERIEPRVTAEVFNLLSIGEKLVSVSATVSYQILHAGVDTFVVNLPKDATAVDIDGEAIKSKEEDKAKGSWTITLQSKRKDSYALYLSFQHNMRKEEVIVPYAGVEAAGVQRETGYLAITTRPDVELSVAEQDISNLTPIDSREIPSTYMQGVSLPVLQAYRYVAHPYTIRIGAAPHEAATVTVAVVEAARLSTTVSDEGNMITDLVCILRNSGQQYLRLQLPETARIWHAFVAGESVTPLRDGNITKLPVARSAGSREAFEVRLRYSDERPKLGRAGGIGLACPLKDIDIMRLGWTLSLPSEYDIVRSTGNIEPLLRDDEMERKLQELNPDAPVEVRLQANAPQEQQMNLQWRFNDDNTRRIQKGAAGAQPLVSIYTGSRPLHRAVFHFQSLIVRAKEEARLDVQYVKGSLGIPLKGAVAVVVVLLCAGLMRRSKARRWMKLAALLVAVGLVLALRTLAEDAYRGYLTTVLYTLLVLAGIMLVYAIGAGIRDAWRRRSARRQPGLVVEVEPSAPPPHDKPPTEGQPGK